MGTPALVDQSDTKAIKVTVIGHASTRWRGAKDQAEADRLNQALSNQRADNVRLAVVQALKKLVPGVKIIPGSSLPAGQHPNGLMVGAYGVGSRQPVLNPPKSPKVDPKENERLNRSVQVMIDLTATHHGSAGVTRAPRNIGVQTKKWKAKVMRLDGVGLGGAAFGFEIVIRNPQSGKQARYKSILVGGSLPKLDRPSPIDGVGEEFEFETNDGMRFKNFKDRWVRVDKVGATLGIKAYATFITFVGLGHGASEISFDSGFSVGLINLEAFAVGGTLEMIGPDPDIVSQIDQVPYTTEREWGDGLIVTFPTGKSGMKDLSAADLKRFDMFIKWWVNQM